MLEMVHNKAVVDRNYQKNAVASGVNIKVQHYCEALYYLSGHFDLSMKFLPFLWLVLTVLHYGAVYIEMLEINCETRCLVHEYTM
jgi:hypothetical protein